MEEGPEILHLDRHVVVVSKRAGLMVEPDRLGHPNVQELLEEELQCNLWVVHRLDRPTSGVLVLAKNKFACTGLMRQFEERTIHKRYTFKTTAELPEGPWTWVDQLEKQPEHFRSVVVDAPHGKRAELRGERIESFKAVVEPQTGRYHQIRIQASHRGYPILGDTFYGGSPWEREGIALHSGYLAFQHPKTGETLEFEVPAPF